jgi:hypothetical protein
MDFSPTGKYAAFAKWGTQEIQVYESSTGQLRTVPTFGQGGNHRLVWSARDDTFFVRVDNENWEISLEPTLSYRRLTTPPSNFANHYGRLGDTWSYDGVRYTGHRDGRLRLAVRRWSGDLIVNVENGEALRFRDPAGRLGIQQGVFLEGTGEILVGVGDLVYALDVASRRIGPIIRGEQFIALIKPFAKQSDL